MPAGPLYPRSAVPTTVAAGSRTYPSIHTGPGSGSKEDEGLGVQGNITVTGRWRLRFDLPPTLPVGTPKLRLWGIANSTGNQNARVRVNWRAISVGSSPSAASLSAEPLVTFSFTVATANQYIESKIPLVALAMAGSQIVVMDLAFEAAGWTLSADSTWIPAIIWE